ncbi:uncharacterized protein LOC118012471 isoform X2 [Mirounga leonina]|uniref:uncharacterized protein LOC118012471 isoform X2 n=1 Tax=Mirounga leonina TaxID=9715 RepID=UPI00156C095A|nr:uncharacterized protein LOC118012471 isoform X2 [Mirounga leonina]
MGKGHRDPNGNGHFIFPLKKLEHMESLMFASIPRTQIEEYIYEEEEPYSFIERNGEIGWKKENLKRMFCKGNTATCLPSMVIGASHPVAMWKADKLSSYCQGPRGACRRYSASLAFRAPIQRRMCFTMTEDNVIRKLGHCALNSSIDVEKTSFQIKKMLRLSIPVEKANYVVSFPSIWENSIITRSPLLRGIHPVSHAAETPRAHSETILLTEDPFVM